MPKVKLGKLEKIKIEKIKREAKEFRKELENRIITLIVSAFGFVTALAWNDAMTSWINTFIKPGDVWYYKIINAIIITLISAIVIYLIVKFSRRK